MKIFIVIGLALTVLTLNLRAQMPNVDAKKTEMKKLEKWVGQWRGSGWSQYGPKRETFTGTETIQRKIDGLALLVEGRFTNPEGRVIHEKLAVLSYDEKIKGYGFNTFLASGSIGDHVLKVLPESYAWGFETPSGTVRFTIKIDNDVWFEIGEFSRDGGKTWIKTFEMKLDRVK